MADIIHRIGIKAPAARVYEMISTARGVAGWWTQDTSDSAKPGGKVNVLFRGPDGNEIGQMDFEMTRLDANREVQWRILAGPPEWLGTDVTFELTEAADMTIVNFGHRNWKEPVEFMGHCSMKWATFLMSLRDLVETGEGKPAPRDVKVDNWN